MYRKEITTRTEKQTKIANFKQNEKLAKMKTLRNTIHVWCRFHEGVRVLT